MSEIPVMIDKIEKLKDVNEEYKSIEPIISKKASVVIPLLISMNFYLPSKIFYYPISPRIN